MTEKKKISFNEIWDKIVKILWDEKDLADGIYEMMRHKIEKETYQVIDVSGGTGLPLISLNQKSDIIATYNDGDQEMEEIFIKKSNGEIPTFHGDWRELSEEVGTEIYDVALCRGNSLIYVDSWEGSLTKDEEAILTDLQKSIDNFFAILKPGGILYLDKNAKVDAGSYTVQKTDQLNGEAIHIDWTFTNDVENKIRIWDNKVALGEDDYHFQSYGYLLTEELLERLCYNAGFIQFEKIKIKGEDIYQSYLVRKPDQTSNTFAYYNEQNKIYRAIWNENGQICWGRYENEALSFSEAGKAHIEYMAQLAKIDQNATILDIGCGNGMTSMYLADTFGCSVIGIDPSSANIKEANRANHNSKVKFICDVVKEGQFDKNTFTHIWSNAAICHIPKPSRIALFKILHEIIHPEGLLIFDDAFTPDPSKVNTRSLIHFYRRLHYDALFDEKEYKTVLEDSGFEVNYFEDLTRHFIKSYEVLSERADQLGYACLANDYQISAEEGQNRGIGWALFCGKPLKTSG